MRKIVLVNPPKLSEFPGESCIPPLGLLYIASTLEKNGFEVSLVDGGTGGTVKKIARKTLNAEPDIVGITSMTPTYPYAEEIAKRIKAENREIKTAVGGPHVTFLPDEVLSTGVFDFVVRNEGEITFLELCSGKKPAEIKGLSFVHGKRIIHNPDREFIKDLDMLPRPSYHLLDFESYQDRYPPSGVRKTPWISFSSSRGCPFGCFYCSVTNFWGRLWRGHSAERVASDLEYLYHTYRLKSVFFVDDNFTFKRDRILRLCDLIKDLDFEWSCSCRVDQVDPELLSKMRSAGCWRIGFGIEAGTQKVIDWYGKKITIEKAKRAVKACRDVGISPFCFFITGAPIETEEDIEKTIEVAKELDPDIIGVSHLTPFPGSRLYDYVCENDLLLTRDWKKYDETVPTIKTKVPWKRIKELNTRMYREFYFRPKYIFRQIGNALRNPKSVFAGFKTILKWVRP